jgi:hypothetical protein
VFLLQLLKLGSEGGTLRLGLFEEVVDDGLFVLNFLLEDNCALGDRILACFWSVL